LYSLLGPAPRSSTLTSNLPRVDIALNDRNALNVEWNRIRSVGERGRQLAALRAGFRHQPGR
jgi:hypothetical protein